MNITDKLIAADQIGPIMDRARLHHRMARMARDATPQFGPEFELPPAFGAIPTEYRMFRGYVALPVSAMGFWLLEEPC